jgi:hypothetical protein
VPDYITAAAPPDELAPVLDWDTFMGRVFDWRQDQHVAIIGPTDQGKSNLAFHLLKLRSYVAYLGIKSEDRTLDAFAAHGGYTRLYDWPPSKRGPVRHKPITWTDMPRRLVWPDASNRRGSRLIQQRVFSSTLDDCWTSGRVCVVWDDFWYLVRILKMELDAKQNLLNARSALSPQMIIAQRGAGNRMVELFDQPVWLFFARETDPRNLQLLGPTSSPRRGFVSHLDQFQFLVENTRTGEMFRVTAPELALAA